MRRFFLILFLILTITIHFAFGQEFLPNISIISHNGKVVVSWQNNYKKTISNILIQRSYDSLKNFSTIGTVLNPLNKENGYMDANPPYKRMYYRVLISFDGGAYEIGKSVRPDIEEIELQELNVTFIPKVEASEPDSEITLMKEDSTIKIQKPDSLQIIKNDKTDSLKFEKDSEISIKKEIEINKEIDSVYIINLEKKSLLVSPILVKRNHEYKFELQKNNYKINYKSESKISFIQWEYPSNRIFINNQNNIIIQLKKTASRKYSIKIFDESDHLVLNINKITEDILFLDKSNFRKSGWYHFELLNDGEIIEKNKFQIVKDKSQK